MLVVLMRVANVGRRGRSIGRVMNQDTGYRAGVLGAGRGGQQRLVLPSRSVSQSACLCLCLNLDDDDQRRTDVKTAWLCMCVKSAQIREGNTEEWMDGRWMLEMGSRYSYLCGLLAAQFGASHCSSFCVQTAEESPLCASGQLSSGWLLDPDAAQRCKKQVRTREDMEHKGMEHRTGRTGQGDRGAQWTAPA
ncbi:hypothetical protein CMUS01_01642 [Colletotrichum musicola]|uniref:Uncharacterized protein n=1 Tax=Colletotrichum musicola TaxID=2175873 RepID=A0A8H6U8I4_9PEZI|nr:hypothetical protein CMUS01_01642 [Colletotrichum musicola]